MLKVSPIPLFRSTGGSIFNIRLWSTVNIFAWRTLRDLTPASPTELRYRMFPPIKVMPRHSDLVKDIQKNILTERNRELEEVKLEWNRIKNLPERETIMTPMLLRLVSLFENESKDAALDLIFASDDWVNFESALKRYGLEDVRMKVVKLLYAWELDYGFRSGYCVNNQKQKIINFCANDLPKYRLNNHPDFPNLLKRFDTLTDGKASRAYHAKDSSDRNY